MGFFKKLFRRKKGSGEDVGANKGSKKTSNSQSKNKGKPLQPQKSFDGAQKSPRVDTSAVPLGRSSSYPSKRETKYEDVRKLESENSRTLSPSNKFSASPPSVMTSKGTYQTAAAVHDENIDKSNSISPRLNQQQLKQFEIQNSTSPPVSLPQAMYSMSGDIPPGQMYAMDDMNRSDASSSSFNLSTDAEDSEYESLRRRGVLPGTAGANLSNLDISLTSGPPTTYSMDSSTGYPSQNVDEDLANRVKTAAMLRPIPAPMPDDEPGRIFPSPKKQNQIHPVKSQTEDDFRAWTINPTSPSSKEVADASNSNASPNKMFAFEGSSSARRSEPGGHTPRSTSSGGDPPPSNPKPTTAPRNFTSPKSQASSSQSGFSPDPDFDFGEFATFGNNAFATSNTDNAWREEKKTQDMPSSHHPSKRQQDDPVALASPREASSQYAHSAASSGTGQDSSLSELLAQAKNKQRSSRGVARSNRTSSASVNSAPAITASYLRQHHNLGRYSTGSTQNNGTNYNKYASSDRGASNEGTSISDIIHSLEASNQSRIRNGSSFPRASYSNRSTGDVGAISTARAVKERLREKRRKEREYSRNLTKSKSSESSASELSDNEASESWLFDEVTGALGPRGIAADLESLSGRSARSKNSQGNKSHRSHRSKTRKSRHSTSRRHRSSGESVDSRGSRYSHRSTKSYISQMSEQSRSVANDLLRLEMQLAMVGSADKGDDIPTRIGGSSTSVGGTSRTSRNGRKSYSSSHHRSSNSTGVLSASSHITRRTKVTIVAPPGKLGIILANKADSKGTVVSGVRTSSVLAEQISPGDRIVAIDGEDVSRMTVSEITTIMSRKGEYERTLTVLTTAKQPDTFSTTKYGQVSTSTDRRSPTKSSMAVGPDGFDASFSQYQR